MFAGTLFVLPGLIAIMALSWIYVLLGKLTIVEGLFFGLKAAVLVVVVEAVLRVGKRALRNNVMVALAAISFVAIFFYDVPFPIIVFGAGIIGYVAGRAGLEPFLAGGGHGKVGAKQVADRELLLGEETPDHARPNLRWSLSIAAVFLALWLVPVAALYLAWAATTSSPRSPSSSARWPWSPLAAPTPCWPMSPSRRSSTIIG